jgi:hypothetical protein
MPEKQYQGKVCIVWGSLLLVLCSCTTLGRRDPGALRRIDFGPSQEIRICVLLDHGISDQFAMSLLQSWNEQEGRAYNLFLRPVSFQRHQRTGFSGYAILSDLKKLPVPDHCDRMFYFVGRTVSDFAYGIAQLIVPLPEMAGAVNEETATHGFVVSTLATPGQLLSEVLRASRREIFIHEVHHLLGCQHAYSMTECYEKISSLKELYNELQTTEYYQQFAEAPFFPVKQPYSSRLFTLRSEVNAALRHHVRP